jgi:hypothetical protein
MTARDACAQAVAQGVYVDAEGVLRTVVVDAQPGDRLKDLRRRAVGRAVGPVAGKTTLRKVSLAGVARAVKECVAAGKPIPDDVQLLAGIQQIQYVFVYPDEHDIVIAGPAEGWEQDAAGRVIGVSTKRPVLRLDDLVAALRVFPPRGNPNVIVGCTINHTAEGMQRLQQYMASVGKSIGNDLRRAAPVLAQGVRNALGLHNVEIWGVPSDSHFGLMLVEADYRMKLIACGLDEPRVRGLQSFYSLIGPADTGRLKLQHWWFVPDYEAIVRDEEGTAFEFRGQRAKLVGADDRVKPGGETEKGTRASSPTQRFAQSFSAHFEELARVVPVFAELQNGFDLVILAALIQHGNIARQVAPDLGFFYELNGGYAAESLPVPKHVDSIVNAKVIGNRLATPAGGVTMEPTRVLGSESTQKLADSSLRDRRAVARPQAAGTGRWWSD